MPPPEIDPIQPTPSSVSLGRRDPVSSALWSFFPSTMPLMARRNYARELSAIFFLPWMLAAVEGGIIGVVVKVSFTGIVPVTRLNFAVATVAAAPALANIFSFIWVRLSHGLDKIRFVVGLQLVVLVLVSTMANVPFTQTGLHAFVLLVIAARICYAGIVTLRSTIWTANYPANNRARVAGKITTIQVELVALAGLIVGQAMVRDEEAFRFILPIYGAIGLIGIWRLSKMRLRRGRSLQAAERQFTEDEGAPSLNPVALWRVLTNDRRFGAFMFCQMLIGIGNLMLNPVIIVVLEDRFHEGYAGVIIAHTIPLALMPLFIPFWARLLDRVHIIRFRSIHSWFFVLTAAAYYLAATHDIPHLLYLAAFIKGIAFGGGALAWTLGHLDFAPVERASQYMGVHVTLTGLRGLIAPILGIQLYIAFEHTKPGSGPLVFLVSLAISVAGAIGFMVLGQVFKGRSGGLHKPN